MTLTVGRGGESSHKAGFTPDISSRRESMKVGSLLKKNQTYQYHKKNQQLKKQNQEKKSPS